MIRTILTFVLGLLLLTQTGCTVAEAVTRQAMKGLILAEIDAAEALWQSHNIRGYRMTVRSSSEALAQADTITVRDGVVIEHSVSCNNAPVIIDGECASQPDPQMFTVDGLFALTRQWVDFAATGESASYQLEGLSFSFDPVYGYPTRIISSPYGVFDAEKAFTVEAYEDLS